VSRIDAAEVVMPVSARQALERGEDVLVLADGAPAFMIVSLRAQSELRPRRARGRSVAEVFDALSRLQPADPDFSSDLEAALGSIGSTPSDPWASS
jgi:antitoxin (DNA-binding transcriptional repressor) of toxin-antitoxin stability system